MKTDRVRVIRCRWCGRDHFHSHGKDVVHKVGRIRRPRSATDGSPDYNSLHRRGIFVCLAATGCLEHDLQRLDRLMSAKVFRDPNRRKAHCPAPDVATDHHYALPLQVEDDQNQSHLSPHQSNRRRTSTDAVPATIEAVSSQTIDLPTALMLTAGRSPQVAFANARIEESRPNWIVRNRSGCLRCEPGRATTSMKAGFRTSQGM